MEDPELIIGIICYLVFWKKRKTSKFTLPDINRLSKLFLFLTRPPLSLDPSFLCPVLPSVFFQPLTWWWQTEGSLAWDLSAQPLPPTWHASLPPSGKPVHRKVCPLTGFFRVNRAATHSFRVKMGKFTSCKTWGRMPSRRHRDESPSKVLFTLSESKMLHSGLCLLERPEILNTVRYPLFLKMFTQLF